MIDDFEAKAVLDIKFERPVTVFSPYDVLDIVDRYCGWDMARYLRSLFDSYADADRECEARLNTDLDSYEASLESNTTAFQDILTEIEGLEKELGRTRLNRENLRKRLNVITTIISNQI